MKFLFIPFLLVFNLFCEEVKISKSSLYKPDVVPENMTILEKKKRFFSLLAPVTKKIHRELLLQYIEVKDSLKTKKSNPEILALKKLYKVSSNEELLYALKPHPVSIVLAQAAMESAWATSRFFQKANNVFGMWSYNTHEPRIAASEKRDGKKTIWLKKFNSIEESIRAYYIMIGRGYAYKIFREYRYNHDDIFEIVKGLDRYSEIGTKYVKELSSMIRYNKLNKYD